MDFILVYSIIIAVIFIVWFVFVAKMYKKMRKKS